MGGSQMLVKPRVAAERLNIEVQTLREYAEEGLIPCTKTPRGHRRYDLELVEQALRLAKPQQFAPLEGDGDARVTPTDHPLSLAEGWAETFAIQSFRREDEDDGVEYASAPFLGVHGTARFVLDPNLLAAV
jgi:MerR family regulatory protein